MIIAIRSGRGWNTTLTPIQNVAERCLLDRAERYEKKAAKLNAHAKELRDYVAQRKSGLRVVK